ncbi:MAG: aminoglycoside phosphotransferase family protein [Gaiellaceae bacterium]
MHENEVLADPPLVRRLLAEQMPQWAGLQVAEVPLGGTDNAVYRLGDDLVVRLPRIEWAVEARAKEHHWLPRLAPLLPVAIPVPLALGKPGAGYPWPWSVYRWLDGADPSIHHEIDRDALVPDLVRFIEAMHRIELPDGPSVWRAGPLEVAGAAIEKALGVLGGTVDQTAIRSVWQRARAAPQWNGPPRWVHADLDARNILVARGRLSAVIDWSGAGVGDPACDIGVAWKGLSPAARAEFRAALDVDDATWERARGWTLTQAVNALSYYTPLTYPILAREAELWLTSVLEDT